MVTKSKSKTRNKFESRTESFLSSHEVEFEYEAESIPYVLHGRYKSDFTIRCKSGKKIVVETKGYFRPEDKRKMAAVRKQHPELDLRILFYSRNETNVKWCVKHGFPFAIGCIPKDWLDEMQKMP